MHIFIYFFKSANIIKVPFDMSMTMYLVSVAWVGFLWGGLVRCKYKGEFKWKIRDQRGEDIVKRQSCVTNYMLWHNYPFNSEILIVPIFQFKSSLLLRPGFFKIFKSVLKLSAPKSSIHHQWCLGNSIHIIMQSYIAMGTVRLLGGQICSEKFKRNHSG